jgi:hypothetical protein
MRLVVHRAQPRDRDVCVELRCGQRRVAEEFLHDPQIRTPLEQMGGGAVPQAVRPDVRSSRHRGDSLVHDGAGLSLIEPTAAGAEQ